MQMFFFTTANDCLSLSCNNNLKCFYILGQLYLKDKIYSDFVDKIIKNPFVFTILDNGAGDKSTTVDNNTLIKLVKKIQPTEVIPLDYPGNTKKTIDSCKDFIERLKKINTKTKILFVPQGKNKKEYISCYKWALENKNISTIGLAKNPSKNLFCNKSKTIEEGRNNLIEYLFSNNLVQKPLHLLGCGSIKEFEYYNEFYYMNPYIRSCDSCIAYLSSVYTTLLTDKNWRRFETPSNLFDIKTNMVNRIFFYRNKQLTRQYLKKPQTDIILGESQSGKTYYKNIIKTANNDIYDVYIDIGEIAKKITTKKHSSNVDDNCILNYIRQKCYNFHANERVLIVGLKSIYMYKQLLVLFDIDNVFLLENDYNTRKSRFESSKNKENKKIKFETIYKKEKELRDLIKLLKKNTFFLDN